MFARRRGLAALAACASLLAYPATAQQQRLEDLIPDSAVENPEAWAEDGVPQDDGAAETVPELSVDDPLEPMPLLTVPPPAEMDLPDVSEVEPAEDPIEFADFDDEDLETVELGSPEEISDELILVFPSDRALFPQREEFLTRFESLSTIEALDDDAEDSIARVRARSQEDEGLLNRLLRVYGYYDAEVIRSVGDVAEGTDIDAEPPAARFDIVPGPQYTVGAVDLGNLDDARTFGDFEMLRDDFEVFPGDPLLQDKIEEEQIDLDVALGENGYPFASIEPPSILVDHARDEGDVTLPVEPGGKYNFGRITSNLPDFMSADHLEDIARFDPGDLYMRSDEQDLRQAILATGLVSSVVIQPVETEAPEGGEPGTVDVEVEMTEAPLRTIAGSIGYGTEEGIRVEGSWEHRNLFPPEGSLRVRGIAGTQEQLVGVTFRKNNFKGRDRILTLDTYASTIDYDAYDAQTVAFVGTYERRSTLLFQKPLSWSVGLELVATGEREADANGDFVGPRETYFVAALPLFAQIDTSDDLLDPTEGFRIAGRLSPEVSRNDGVQSFYLRSQADFSYYQSIGERVVLAGRARVASIPGTSVDNIAPSRRLYAGGGGSVRGYGYREIGPRNNEGDLTGGRGLVELSAEARIRTPLFDNSLAVVPFVDAGSVSTGPTPDFDTIKVGAGLGFRYHTSFGPFRIDFAVPLNPGPNDSAFAVYVALGQAF